MPRKQRLSYLHSSKLSFCALQLARKMLANTSDTAAKHDTFSLRHEMADLSLTLWPLVMEIFVAKAMTEVREPGANSKAASVPFVFQFEAQMVSH